MRDRAQLLGHRKAPLLQPDLRCWNRQMQRIAELGAGERHGEREAEPRLVQLIDRNDHERTSFGLLTAPRWVRIGPVDITLVGTSVYHSGAGPSKADPIPWLSAR